MLASLLALAASCTRKNADQGPAQATSASDEPSAGAGENEGDPAAAAALPESCKGTKSEGELAWHSDDYARALDCAQKTRRPLFIDLWAAWCHTCLSMKHTVFLDKSLAPLADRFVWLEIDTEKETNAAALDRFPAQVWPTFYVIAPDETVQGRYLGAASITQLRAFLEEGEKAVLAVQGGDLPEGSPLRLIRDGDRAMAQEEWTAARISYGQAVAALDKDALRRPDVLVSMISAFYKGGDYPGCFTLAEHEMASTGKSASAADFLYYGATCADALLRPEAYPTGTTLPGQLPTAAAIKAFREAAVARLAGLVNDDSAPLSVDDRADAMRIAREITEALGNKDAARALAEKQRALLDDAAEKAETPFAAMTFHWPRAEVYAYLGKAAELVPILQKSMADLPGEYDPPYRLAWIYQQLGKNDDALAAAEKALALAYGPRKARIQNLIGDIHKTRGDRDAERAARAATIALYKALPPGQAQPSALAQAEATLAALDAKKPAKGAAKNK